MIFYFSGTGNSKWVAEQMAIQTNDACINIIGLRAIPSIDEQIIGLVFPIYAWGVPEPVINFVKQLKGKPAYTFGICTCGGEAGNAMELLEAKFPMNSTFSIVMPNNYVMGSTLEDEEEVLIKLSNAKVKIAVIAHLIETKQSLNDVATGKLGWLKSSLVNFGFNMASRSTKPFLVTDKCISCGLCAENCPANTITMKNSKPIWDKKCYQCTACINLCPTAAIEYGKGTKSRGRYRLKDYENQVATLLR